METIIRSSSVIKFLYDNYVSELEDEEPIKYETYVIENFLTKLNEYNERQPKSKLTKKIVYDILNIFEKTNLHVNFLKPKLEEYFNKNLNFLLIIDFLMSMKFELKKSNVKDMLDYFITLSHFFNFMNYLDVDSKLLDYLKYMLTLYLLFLNRTDIEEHFGHVIWTLDQFFKHEIIKELYVKMDKKIAICIKSHDLCLRLYNNLLTDYNLDINYLIDSDYLNCFFQFDINRGILVKLSEAERVVITEDDEDYDSADDEGGPLPEGVQRFYISWRSKPKIDCSDSNYEIYKKLFIYKIYQVIQNAMNDFDNFIKSLDIGIKKYDKITEFTSSLDLHKCSIHYKEEDNDECYLPLLLTFIGEKLDIDTYKK